MQKFAALTAVFSAALLLSGCGINNIPTYKQQVTASWSQVLNEYQRRTDLIPNLVATVKGYAAHESSTLEAVTNARAKVTQTQIPANILSNPQAFHQFEQNQATLSGALSRLMMVTENYPNLKANQNFLALQSQLEGTENRIAVARRDYILAVQQYDTELTTIPGRWYHSMFYSSYPMIQNFTIAEQAQQAPKVTF
ncbi:MAG: LemA family protein [Gammaproteobacteria bacterium]